MVELTTEFNNLSDPKNLIILILSLGLMAFFTYKIHMCKKWARTTFIVLFLLGVIMYPFTLIQFFNLSTFIGIISSIQTGLQLFAIILLFKKDSRSWYKNLDSLETKN